MAVKRNYRINLRNYGNPPAIMVSQYDENYDLVFEVYDGVVPATGLNVYTVKLVGRQPGDDPALKYEFTGTVSGIANNILSFTIDTTMTGRAGKGTAEIVILDATNDVKFASFNLPVYVEKAAVPDDAIDADVERAQEIADEVQEIVDTAAAEVKGEAESWAVGQRDGEDVPSTDPTYENNAKYYAEQAQDIADSIGIDATLSISGKAADAKKTGDEISSLKEDLNAIQTATSEDVGKALKAKTVADGKVVEWEFGEAGGEDYYTVQPSLNLCDSSGWTTAATAPLLPAEYGKTYSANINYYNANIYVFDASKNSLGKLSVYGGITVTKGSYYDGNHYKYTYEVTNQNIAYMQIQYAKPSDIVPMYFEGDVTIPINPILFTDVRYTPTEPALGTLKSVMLANHKVARAELDADLSNAVNQLGYSNRVVNASDLVDFDASDSDVTVSDGVVQVKDGITVYGTDECLYFDKSIYAMHYKFTNVVNPVNPWIIVKDNTVENGLALALSRTGMTYIYYLKPNNSTQAKDNSYAWTADNPLVSVDIVRESDRYILTFVDSMDEVIVKTYTFAQLGIVGDPGMMGIYPNRPGGSNRNCAVVCTDLKISAKASISGGGASASSRLNEKTWDAWGDSFTAGDGTYVDIIEEATGCTVTNLGLTGDKVSSVLARFNARADACGSYVTVFAGVNDFLHDTAMATFRANVQDMITAVITKAPSSKFGWVIPPQTTAQATNTLNLTLEDYDDAIIEICRANSVPVLDLYHEGGWYTNSAFTSIYIGGDGLHPSAQGQALLADKIQMFLERL